MDSALSFAALAALVAARMRDGGAARAEPEDEDEDAGGGPVPGGASGGGGASGASGGGASAAASAAAGAAGGDHREDWGEEGEEEQDGDGGAEVTWSLGGGDGEDDDDGGATSSSGGGGGASSDDVDDFDEDDDQDDDVDAVDHHQRDAGRPRRETDVVHAESPFAAAVASSSAAGGSGDSAAPGAAADEASTSTPGVRWHRLRRLRDTLFGAPSPTRARTASARGSYIAVREAAAHALCATGAPDAAASLFLRVEELVAAETAAPAFSAPAAAATTAAAPMTTPMATPSACPRGADELGISVLEERTDDGPRAIVWWLPHILGEEEPSAWLDFALWLATAGVRLGPDETPTDFFVRWGASEQYTTQNCGKSWRPGVLVVSCHDCERDSTAAICLDCFRDGDHADHDYKIHRSGGGMCDCGDPLAWKKQGFCRRHRGTREDFDCRALLSRPAFVMASSALLGVVDILTSGLILAALAGESADFSPSSSPAARTLLAVFAWLGRLVERGGDVWKDLLASVLSRRPLRPDVGFDVPAAAWPAPGRDAIDFFVELHDSLPLDIRRPFFNFILKVTSCFTFKRALLPAVLRHYRALVDSDRACEDLSDRASDSTCLLEVSVQIFTVSTLCTNEFRRNPRFVAILVGELERFLAEAVEEVECCLCHGPDASFLSAIGYCCVSHAYPLLIPSLLDGSGGACRTFDPIPASIFSCGHSCHVTCFERYFDSLRRSQMTGVLFEGLGKISVTDGEFLCPQCRRLSNILLPWSFGSGVGGGADVLSEVPDDRGDVSVRSFDEWRAHLADPARATAPPRFASACDPPAVLSPDGGDDRSAVLAPGIADVTARLMACVARLMVDAGHVTPDLAPLANMRGDFGSLQNVIAFNIASCELALRTADAGAFQRGPAVSCLWELVKTGLRVRPEREIRAAAFREALSLLSAESVGILAVPDLFVLVLRMILSGPDIPTASEVCFVVRAVFPCVLIQLVLCACARAEPAGEPSAEPAADVAPAPARGLERVVAALHAAGLVRSARAPPALRRDVEEMATPFLRKCLLLHGALTLPTVPAAANAAERISSLSFPELCGTLALPADADEAVEGGFPFLERWLAAPTATAPAEQAPASASSAAAAPAVAGRPVGAGVAVVPLFPPSFAPPALPAEFHDLLGRHAKLVCPTCRTVPKNPLLCISCGEMSCAGSTCCDGPDGRPELHRHLLQCRAFRLKGLFLLVNECRVLALQLRANSVLRARYLVHSLYKDKYGEEDPGHRRGQRLFLDRTGVASLVAYLLGNLDGEILRTHWNAWE